MMTNDDEGVMAVEVLLRESFSGDVVKKESCIRHDDDDIYRHRGR